MPDPRLLRWIAPAIAVLSLPAAAPAAPPERAPALPPVAAGPLSPITPQPGVAAPQPVSPTGNAPAIPGGPAAPPEAAAPAPAIAAPSGTVAVTAWGLSQSSPRGMTEPPPPVNAVSGGPLYVWLTIDGGQAAVNQLQSGTPLAIQIHWTSANPASSAPNEVTNLTVGRPDLAPVLAGEVQRTGHFVWHSWARKDTLSPGRWMVSVTDAGGRPLQCGTAAPHPCQASLEVGAS